MAQGIVERFLERKKDGEPQLLNVNIPNLPLSQLQGVVATRLGRRHHAESVIKEVSPRGFSDLLGWCGRQAKGSSGRNGLLAVEHNAVSVTPLQVDLTNYSAFVQSVSG